MIRAEDIWSRKPWHELGTLLAPRWGAANAVANPGRRPARWAGLALGWYPSHRWCVHGPNVQTRGKPFGLVSVLVQAEPGLGIEEQHAGTVRLERHCLAPLLRPRIGVGGIRDLHAHVARARTDRQTHKTDAGPVVRQSFRRERSVEHDLAIQHHAQAHRGSRAADVPLGAH